MLSLSNLAVLLTYSYPPYPPLALFPFFSFQTFLISEFLVP